MAGFKSYFFWNVGTICTNDYMVAELEHKSEDKSNIETSGQGKEYTEYYALKMCWVYGFNMYLQLNTLVLLRCRKVRLEF